jgi:predicted phage gp36 major capsid-like protein
MKSNVELGRSVFPCLLLVLSLSIPVMAIAQQKQLSVEELEAYIAEQKVVLEEARANRDKTQQKVEKVREALDEQDARKLRVEEELETLCKEQEELNPGSYNNCKSHSNS